MSKLLTIIRITAQFVEQPLLFNTIPKPDSKAFAPKALGASTSWSPRHSNVASVAKALPNFSSLVRPSANLISIAIPNNPAKQIDFFDDSETTLKMNPSKKTSASTTPLRQVIFEVNNGENSGNGNGNGNGNR